MSMSAKSVLAKLRSERNELKRLAKRQRKAEVIAEKAKKDRKRIEREIRGLKAQTSKSLTSRAVKIARASGRGAKSVGKRLASNRNKKRLKKAAGALKSGFKKFQKFADSLPD